MRKTLARREVVLRVDPVPEPNAAVRGRVAILMAAILWSTSGAFTKVLTQPTGFGLDQPPLEPRHLACFRTLFASAFLLCFIRPHGVTFRPLMVFMAGCFAAMNYLFVAAMSAGTAADAILLQYTAPMWAVLGCIWLLHEPADRRSVQSIVIGFTGILIIVAGGWRNASLDVVALGLTSGFAYAWVLICLRIMRHDSPAWLTAVNHLTAGLVLLPFVLPLDVAPTFPQWVVIFLYGTVQMGLAYLLMARGLRSVSPQEAGAITLLEPVLNPLWTYLVAGEVPSPWSFAGGAFILGALAWRYWPRPPLAA